MNPNLFHKYSTVAEKDQNSCKTPFDHRSSNSADDCRGMQSNAAEDVEHIKNHIKTETFMENDDAIAKSPSHIIDEMDDEDVFQNNSTSSSFYGPHSAIHNTPHADNSEHSLMKMQMRKCSFSIKMLTLYIFPQQQQQLLKTL